MEIKYFEFLILGSYFLFFLSYFHILSSLEVKNEKYTDGISNFPIFFIFLNWFKKNDHKKLSLIFYWFFRKTSGDRDYKNKISLLTKKKKRPTAQYYYSWT